MWNLRKEVQVYCWGSVPLQSGGYKEVLLYRPKYPPPPISPLSPTPKATTRKAFKPFSPEEMCVAGYPQPLLPSCGIKRRGRGRKNNEGISLSQAQRKHCASSFTDVPT